MIFYFIVESFFANCIDFRHFLCYDHFGTSVPGEHHTVAVASFIFLKGVNFSFSPFSFLKGGDIMYITLTELLMILNLIVALAHYYKNNRDK